ncbi:MAG: RluA family pseudouridine synthase [Myxococcota bacterium]|nr:RluA family pseudouridine synthase [Myxococcota bacterium]
MERIEVIYEDQERLVVNKPAGVTVHNGPANLIECLQRSEGQRLHLVHRLDRETSGLLLLAKTPAATTRLQAALASIESCKSYLAIVRGCPRTAHGTWTRAISAKAEGRKNPAGLSRDRVPAQTDFERIDQTPWLSLLRCELKSGRQHQIRKHAALAGCPLVGDRRYGDPKHAKTIARRFAFEGLALHAVALSIQDQGERLTFRCPPPQSWACFGFSIGQSSSSSGEEGALK